MVTREWGQARLGLSCFPVQLSPVPSGLAEAVYASLKATAPALGILECPQAYVQCAFSWKTNLGRTALPEVVVVASALPRLPSGGAQSAY